MTALCRIMLGVLIALIKLCDADDTLSGLDTLKKSISISVADTQRVPEATSLVLYKSPIKAVMYSAVFPGAGQFYLGNRIRGVLFGLIEATAGIYSIANYYQAQFKDDESKQYLDSIKVYESDTSNNEIFYRLMYANSRYGYQRYHLWNQHSICWIGGIYLYNIMDALQKSGAYATTEKKDPFVAGWLSAIPGLGLGQIYNGSFSKAGMLWMVEGTLGFMAYNYHQQMRNAEDRYQQINNPDNPEHVFAADKQIGLDSWKGKRDLAFRMRNTYLWYFVLFYFYGIFDAVVDAHLHDAPAKMRLEPDLNPQSGSVSVSVNVSF